MRMFTDGVFNGLCIILYYQVLLRQSRVKNKKCLTLYA